MCQQNWFEPFSPLVSAFDACGSGHASVDAVWDLDNIFETAIWHERWRFKEEHLKDGETSFRERALARLLETAREPVVDGIDTNPEFKELNPKYIDQVLWKTEHFTPMDHKEPIHQKEMRGLLATMRRRLGRQAQKGQEQEAQQEERKQDQRQGRSSHRDKQVHLNPDWNSRILVFGRQSWPHAVG